MKKPIGVISILSDLVAIDSQSQKGNKEIIALLTHWFADYEYTLQEWIREEDDVFGQNLIVKIPGKRQDKSLVFVCHTDTVPTSALWESNPFFVEEKEGNLYGLGVCDTKGGIASLIEAVLTLQEKPDVDTYLVFDGDEEHVFTGLMQYKKTCKLKNPQFICIEPTDGDLCIAERSILELDIHTSGSALHASYATPEVNMKHSATYKMHQVLGLLIEDAGGLAKEKDEILGTNTQNIGMMQAGNATNVIPESCMLTVDRRLLPQIDLVKEKERIKTLITSVDPKASISRFFGQKGFATSADDPFVTNVLSQVKNIYPKAKTACFQGMSEGTLLQSFGPVVVLGPGSIQQAHSANEFVNTSDLFHYVHVFQAIMLKSSLEKGKLQ